MYSVVLMAALTTGSATPAWGLLGCHGCWGGCHGCYGGGGGCWGGCRGGFGGCWGGCRGGYGGYACNGCYGGGYACYGGYGGCYGWTGGGCYGCYGGWTGVSNYAPTPRRPVDKLPPPKPAEEKKTSADGRARVIVELPGDAKLYVDDQLMKSTAPPRVFKTPSLEQGETYYYMLRAEVVRDGNTRSERKRVLVQAGKEVRVSFPELESVATTRAEAKTKH